MAHDVFISHSSKDKAAADAVCAALEADGIRCWLAARDILPSADWGASIVNAITTAKVFVLIFSQHANTSPYILREVERAVSLNIPLIPFRIEDIPADASLGYFLGAQHWLDAHEPPLQQHLGYLAECVRLVIAHEGAGAPPPPARPPVSAAPPPPPAPHRQRRWRRPLVTGAAALAVIGVAAAIALFRPMQPAAAPPADPRCLVVVPSAADPTACRALLDQESGWEGCAASYADGDLKGRLAHARQMIGAGRTASDLYEASPEFRDYGATSHYWEMVGLCVANGHTDFADLSGAASFPDHYWQATRALRHEFGANWSGPGQALPDFLSNLQALCSRYKAARDKLSPGGKSLNCSF